MRKLNVIFSSFSPPLRQERYLWIALLLYRTVLNPLLLQTFFSPDEYYQSLQVAYHHVFNSGAPLTWEWTIDGPIRGYLHVLPFMILYWLLRWSSLDQMYPAILVLAPKMLQGCIQFIADVYLYRLCTLLFPYKLLKSGNSVALYALLCQIANWFTFYCGARTFGNSMETTVSVVGLYYYYLYNNGSQIHHFWKRWWPWLFFAGLGVVARPTNALFWVPVAIHALLKNVCIGGNGERNDGKRILKNIMNILVVGILPIVLFWIVLSVAIDSVFYGRIVVVMWNFIKFNVIENRAHAYGVQPWHWYFSQGLPVMLLTMLPLMIVSLWYARKNGRQDGLPYPLLPLVLVVFLCGTYSLFAHKEFRFIFPILPLCMMYCGHGLAHLQRIWEQRRNMFKFTVVFILLTNLAAIGYFCLVHLRAPIDVMQVLREKTLLASNSTQSIHFWMPCHHVPGNSHIHGRPVALRMLDCSPDFSGDKNHIDEADRFFSDPGQFIRGNVHSIPPPDYVVMYERLVLENDHVRDYLHRNHFTRIARLFHCHFPEILDRRMSTHVLIYQHTPPDQKSK